MLKTVVLSVIHLLFHLMNRKFKRTAFKSFVTL